jgi:exopolyphosphatase/guanosine-5'-triphosphate,3'-diphosphate pyrophosphatase
MTKKIQIDLKKQFFSMAPPQESKNYGAIDLGTNACRWCVARPFFSKSNDGSNKVYWRFLETKSRNVHMGESLMKNNNKFSEASLGKGLQALQEFQNQSEKYQIGKIKCVGTQACRQSLNAQVFIDLVKKETSLSLDIVTEKEEAFFAFLGNINAIPHYNHCGIILDIGGGSTEMLFYESIKQVVTILDILSIPIGVLKLHDDYCNRDQKLFVKEKINQLCSAFATKNKMFSLVQKHPLVLISSSGSISSVAYVVCGQDAELSHKIANYQGCKIYPHLFQKTFNWIENATHEELMKHEFVGSKKISFIVGSSYIIKSILTHIPVSYVLLSKFGVREGVLYSLYYDYSFQDFERSLQPEA